MSVPLVVSPDEGYRLWAPTFDRNPSAIIALESRTMEPLLGDLNGKTVIDVGCGTGRWLRRLRSLGAHGLGFDLCEEMLHRAAAKPGLHGRLALAGADRLPLPDRCADVALCALTLGHVPHPEIVVAELARISRPGGMVLLSDFHPAALLRGWKRTFRSASGVREIRSLFYSLPGLLEESERRGLIVESVLEPAFGAAERPIFEQAGRKDLFEQVEGIPAVVVVCWRKRSGA